MDSAPDEAIAARVAQLLDWAPSRWREVRGGYTPAARYVVEAGSSRAFVKVATTLGTAMSLRREGRAYAVIRPDLRPRLLGWQDDETQPILIIEDLSAAAWPPPWRDEQVADALARIRALHGSSANLPNYAERHGGREPGWGPVAKDPQPFLSLRLVTADWLAGALPALMEAEQGCSTEGDAVTHWDIRSDNMAFTDDGLKLVDWSEACLSNPDPDLGFWLPSLCFEGGPPPEAILPHAPEVAAWVSGFFAARAALPDIPDAPFVRRVQREQLSTALPWAQRALGLPPLDG
ncbi:MAG TPA: phosphotransferase [Caulobacteraceae bacterium]